jgi:hypothetical protein
MYLRPFPPACEEPSECKGANRRRIIHPSRSDYSDEALTFLVATVPSRKPSGREGQGRGESGVSRTKARGRFRCDAGPLESTRRGSERGRTLEAARDVLEVTHAAGSGRLAALSLLSPVVRPHLGGGVAALSARPAAREGERRVRGQEPVHERGTQSKARTARGQARRAGPHFFCRWNDRLLHRRQMVWVLV